MIAAIRRGLLLSLACAPTAVLAAQDDQARAGRRPLPIDTSRIAPFARSYDVVLQTRDSAAVIGIRTLIASRTTRLGAPAWLLLETRTGAVPAADTLYVTPELRPMRWSAALGPARLAIQFARDSMFGATTSPLGRQNIVAPVPPDLIVSAAMVDLLLPAIFPVEGRLDSVTVLTIDPGGVAFLPGALIVLGREALQLPGGEPRTVWVVALHTEPRYVLFWVDSETGGVVRVQHYLERDRALLEYRLRSAALPPP